MVSDRSGVLWESMEGDKTNNSFDPDRCGNLTEEYTLVSHQYHQQKIRTSVATRALAINSCQHGPKIVESCNPRLENMQ